jgi:ribose 1,5-bisphosphokinase PhnN
VFALVIIGPPGAGKSSVLEALSDALAEDDIRHAMVETEALTATHPPLEDEQWFAHVEATCRLHREHGYDLALLAATVESDRDRRALLSAIGAERHIVVRLHAEPATLAQRIKDREPEGWPGLNGLVAASARLAPVVAGLDGIALTLRTRGPAAGHCRRMDSGRVSHRAAACASLNACERPEPTPQARPRDPSTATETLAIVAADNAALVADQVQQGSIRARTKVTKVGTTAGLPCAGVKRDVSRMSW